MAFAFGAERQLSRFITTLEWPVEPGSRIGEQELKSVFVRVYKRAYAFEHRPEASV